MYNKKNISVGIRNLWAIGRYSAHVFGGGRRWRSFVIFFANYIGKQLCWYYSTLTFYKAIKVCGWRSIPIGHTRVNQSSFLFWTKISGHISRFSRTPFGAKKSLDSVFFGSLTTWTILSWRSFCVCSFYSTLGTWESGMDEVSPEIQGLSSTECNVQDLEFLFLNSRAFKVHANSGK